MNVTFIYISGKTLTYGAYTETGSVRTAAGTSLPEVGSTGVYSAVDNDIVALDLVAVKDSATGDIVGGGQYLPDVSSTSITADLADIETKIDTIDTNVDLVIVEQQRVQNIYDVSEPTAEVKIVRNL